MSIIVIKPTTSGSHALTAGLKSERVVEGQNIQETRRRRLRCVCHVSTIRPRVISGNNEDKEVAAVD